MVKKKGRYSGGTFAHELIAMDFAAWLSIEFRIHIYNSYINGTQHKQGWNIKRVLAASNYKIMCKAVEEAHDSAKPYHYSNEVLMINEIIFGIRDGDVRKQATEAQLDAVSWLESSNATLINLGMDYQIRKEKLSQLFKETYLPEHKEALEVEAVAS